MNPNDTHDEMKTVQGLDKKEQEEKAPAVAPAEREGHTRSSSPSDFKPPTINEAELDAFRKRNADPDAASEESEPEESVPAVAESVAGTPSVVAPVSPETTASSIALEGEAPKAPESPVA